MAEAQFGAGVFFLRGRQLVRHPSLDLSQLFFWQMPLDKEGEETFHHGHPGGTVSPRGVPQGVLNVTPHFQLMMGTEVLAGLVGGSSARCERTASSSKGILHGICYP